MNRRPSSKFFVFLATLLSAGAAPAAAQSPSGTASTKDATQPRAPSATARTTPPAATRTPAATAHTPSAAARKPPRPHHTAATATTTATATGQSAESPARLQADSTPTPTASTKSQSAPPTALSVPVRPARRKPDTGFRLNDPNSPIQLRARLELGFLGVAKHKIQFGKGTTRFNYLKDGGQDNLFFFWRIAADLVLFQRHHIKFLYQPLNLKTQSKLRRDVQIDTVLFPEDTALTSRYGFDFYRATYLYEFLNRWGLTLAVGGGIQIRNARITFTSADGLLRFDSGNIGPVPLLSLFARYAINDWFWLETEVDGFYANLKYINGGDDPVEGAILDASLRAGFDLNHFIETFVNVRYVGGGADGSSDGESVPSDGYTNNWLHIITVGVGLGVK